MCRSTRSIKIRIETAVFCSSLLWSAIGRSTRSIKIRIETTKENIILGEKEIKVEVLDPLK